MLRNKGIQEREGLTLSDKLLLQIAWCDEVSAALEDGNHPCHKIVSSQTADSFQLPEPWNGNITSAEILFVGSNPSYNSSEFFPNQAWDNHSIADFFRNRFSDAYYQKIRFWTLIKKYASWILDVPQSDPKLPEKICITEIVHCKSTREYGVRESCNTCAQKWFQQILESFQGKYIVVLGRVAKKMLPEVPCEKKVVFMPHPNAHGITDEQRKVNLKEQLEVQPK